MKTLVQVSGGAASAYALKLAMEQNDDVGAIFADVKGTGASHFWSDLPSVEILLQERFGGETPDTYRFIWQLSYALNMPVERVEDGRSIWAVFFQHRAFRLFVNGKFFCKASELLKREAIAQHIETNYKPGTYRLAMGFDVMEGHRLHNARNYWQNRLGCEVYSPFIEVWEKQHKALGDEEIVAWVRSIGLELPEAYKNGDEHNNCRAVCTQAGQNQYARLYHRDPNQYLYGAWQERRWQQFTGSDATILKDQRGGETHPMSLYDFIPRIQAGDYNHRDSGSCGCFVTPPMFDLTAVNN